MEWNSKELVEMCEKYGETLPDSGWGTEGCGLAPDEADELMQKSIETGHDYLEESFPDYPDYLLYGA